MSIYKRAREDRLKSPMLHVRVGSAGASADEAVRAVGSAEGTESPDAYGDAFQLLTADERLLLVDFGAGDDVWILLGSAVARLSGRGGSAEELPQEAHARAESWMRTNLARWRRAELPGMLVAYARALAAAETVDAVCSNIMDASAGVFGGYTALLYRRQPDGASYVAMPGERKDHPLESHAIRSHALLTEPGIILRTDPRLAAGGSLASMQSLFDGLSAELLFHIPAGPDYVLFVSERRPQRRVAPEEWEILRLVVEQGVAALRRLELLEEVRNLSLTDELTGIANRRHMRLVVTQALAAARRGTTLALVLIDINDFKQINDRLGHLAGDEALRDMARCLQAHARASDLVVRWGGDEFVVVLPGVDAAGADAFVRRVEKSLAPTVAISVGVAEYDPLTAGTMDQLIHTADRQLYAAKRLRAVSH